MRRDTKLDLYTAGDGNWYKSSLGMYLTQANPSDFVNPYRFAGGDPVSRESLTNFLQYNNYNNFAGVMTDGPSFGQLYGHYLNPRIFGVSQALFGVAEVIGGAASCPAIVGCLVAAHGLDDLQAGLLTAVTGEYYETLTKQAARAVTGSETAATVVDIGTGLASGAAASRLGQAGRLAQSSANATATSTATVTAGGFGIAASARGIEKGVVSSEVASFYSAVANSPSFVRKLAIANTASRIRGRSPVSVDDILHQLQTNTKFRKVSRLDLSRIDPLKSGKFAVRHSGSTNYFSRITAEHELLHMAQFLRDPTLALRARSFGSSLPNVIGKPYAFLRRQPYEFIPATVGSPAIHGSATVIFVGGGVGVGIWLSSD